MLCRCHCKQYVSVEELCDQLCLLKAPRISLRFGIKRELLLRMNEGEVRVSVDRVRAWREPLEMTVTWRGPWGLMLLKGMKLWADRREAPYVSWPRIQIRQDAAFLRNDSSRIVAKNLPRAVCTAEYKVWSQPGAEPRADPVSDQCSPLLLTGGGKCSGPGQPCAEEPAGAFGSV